MIAAVDLRHRVPQHGRQQKGRTRQFQRRLGTDEISKCQREQERAEHLRHALHARCRALQLTLLVGRNPLRRQRLCRRSRHAPQ